MSVTPIHWVLAYLSCADRVPVSLAFFMATLQTCERHPINVGGRPSGILFVKGSEIHACPSHRDRGRWMSKRLLTVLRGVVSRFGYATTTAETEEGERFIRRLGFVPEGGHFVLR